jgi:hypothetical protein
VTGKPTDEQDTIKEMKQCEQVACECNKKNYFSATVLIMKTGSANSTTTYQ